MTNPLGSKVSFSKVIDPKVLYRIARAQNRNWLYSDIVTFEGVDRWTCYELSWLNSYAIPQVGIATISYSAHSTYIVESKSLKLFLGGFYRTQFASVTEVEETIANALNSLLECRDTQVMIVQPSNWERIQLITPPGECIDYCSPRGLSDATALLTEAEVREETLYSNIVRSLCPVTAQPDWATLVVHYRGRSLNRPSLLRYLVDHQHSQMFHEHFCELIFADLLRVTAASQLWVGCFYTRRGGIDINPMRWLRGTTPPSFQGRLSRQ